MAERPFDVVLFGATGFVGALTAEHLAAAGGPGTRVALAGRSPERLAEVRSRLGEPGRDWALVEVDATDAVGLRRLAARTTVLATTVGPYARDGRHVVTACAEEGTHYADLTGELLFVRWALETVDARARETGARIVHACGFDSIPSDLGVLLTADRASADGEGTLADTTLVVRSMRGGISGGTIDSARQQAIALQADPSLRRVLRAPDALGPRQADEPAPRSQTRSGRLGRLRRWAGPERDPETGHWLGRFVMADYNTRVVRLSNALSDGAYGRAFRYREVSDLGPSPLAPLLAVGMDVGLGALQRGLGWTPTRRVLDRILPRPGQGPSPEQRAAGRFRMEITATTTTGARYRTTVAADQDPGYDGTAVMLGQSALCLALDGPRLPQRAGVLTPATALGDALVARLRAHGFTFEVARLP